MAKQINKQTEDIERLLARLSSGQNPKRPLSLDETAEGLTACYLNGMALIEDARLLAANGRQPRALSLTILALEELAKVPDLDQLYIDPRTRENSESWTEFWKRFSLHKPKQKRIAAYGNILRDSAELNEVGFDNPTPYANYLSENTYGHLDNLKQRNFYVDLIGGRFRLPETNKEVSVALDSLFSFAEERSDSFGSWHITAQRSIDFLVARLKIFSTNPSDIAKTLKHTHSFNSWASTHSTVENEADLFRLMCYHSSALIPDYACFLPECENFFAHMGKAEEIALLVRSVSVIKRRMEIEVLAGSRFRAFLMFKLLFSYSTRHLSAADCQEIFGIAPSEEARQHFQ